MLLFIDRIKFPILQKGGEINMPLYLKEEKSNCIKILLIDYIRLSRLNLVTGHDLNILSHRFACYSPNLCTHKRGPCYILLYTKYREHEVAAKNLC